MNRTTQFRLMTLAAMLSLLVSLAPAQQGGKKQYVFRGVVEAVDANAGSLTVKNEKIEGWMEAMTMGYKVDKQEVLKQLKAGDRITATVYDGDYSLHDVKVVPPNVVPSNNDKSSDGKSAPKK